ncbi:hypothetical protein E2C01_029886 [Portunus trituberculatus]|uniref:Uncharacterized protein n=1 Tax=Portunus trituberculatus TaxID=210409 RepID=A0A5B7ET78_PORTR|nr:hypothetical protein [Portunus trituberculatus]
MEAIEGRKRETKEKEEERTGKGSRRGGEFKPQHLVTAFSTHPDDVTTKMMTLSTTSTTTTATTSITTTTTT